MGIILLNASLTVTQYTNKTATTDSNGLVTVSPTSGYKIVCVICTNAWIERFCVYQGNLQAKIVGSDGTAKPSFSTDLIIGEIDN